MSRHPVLLWIKGFQLTGFLVLNLEQYQANQNGWSLQHLVSSDLALPIVKAVLIMCRCYKRTISIELVTEENQKANDLEIVNIKVPHGKMTALDIFETKLLCNEL